MANDAAVGPAVATWQMGWLWIELGFHADEGFVLLAELLNHPCCGFFSGEGTAHFIHVFIFQVVTGTYVVTSWICTSLLKVGACSCRDCQFSSLACDALCPSGGAGSLYSSSYTHNSYNTVTV